MWSDTYGTHDGASKRSRVPVQRSGTDLVAPITDGSPRWRHRYVRTGRAIDVGAVGCAPVLYLLWRDVVSQPVAAVALAVVALLIVGRCALRGWLYQLRRRGRAISTVLVVGDVGDVAALALRTRLSPQLGWRIAAACTPTGTGPAGAPTIAGVEVIGDLDAVAAQALAARYDAVAVCPAPGWTGVRLQQLAWGLDCTSTALLVDPRLVPGTGPRVRVAGVDGLPLLRLEQPGLGRVSRVVKGATDRVAALLALVLVTPLLLACATVVRRDGGPALCHRRRVGRGGQEFTLLTFRTTDRTGAVTRAGRVLRRHCLDELPQLLNVLSGSMALVGPRPGAPWEVSGRGRAGQRWLLVKPGITGLWQVDEGQPKRAGTVDEATSELSLAYVRQWTPARDARILARTVRAVLTTESLRGQG